MVYKLKERENTTCFTYRHILDKNADIFFVSHDKEDDVWQFLCGDDDSLSDSKIVGLGEIVSLHPEKNYLFEMPLGVCAQRSDASSEWKCYKNSQHSNYGN